MQRRTVLVPALLIGAVLVVVYADNSSAKIVCKIENARYQQRFTSSITAKFQDVESGAEWPSKVALLIHTGNTNRSYWAALGRWQ